ncbi:hypothetical protein EQ875_01643 [Photobacterium damselae subsp. damselae]|uniref:nucleotide-binding protein n=1 Tax=Photobacterium damselae TaxID=38293 RepID=UPI00109BEE2A|nr:GTPase [Photobacterium damselae]TGZ35362.1 hypothetical protein EQ875_01643 [Photobacterium damselae subsp. damselae]
MHIIIFNTKGGVGKSTLCEYSSRQLQRLGYAVSVSNTDQQQHVTNIRDSGAQYHLYDTAGAFTEQNVKLLKAARNVDAKIIIPVCTGKNDAYEVDFVLEQLQAYGVKDKAWFVLSKTRSNCLSTKLRRIELLGTGVPVANWTLPLLEDFSEQRDTLRTCTEINKFLNELVLI